MLTDEKVAELIAGTRAIGEINPDRANNKDSDFKALVENLVSLINEQGLSGFLNLIENKLAVEHDSFLCLGNLRLFIILDSHATVEVIEKSLNDICEPTASEARKAWARRYSHPEYREMYLPNLCDPGSIKALLAVLRNNRYTDHVRIEAAFRLGALVTGDEKAYENDISSAKLRKLEVLVSEIKPNPSLIDSCFNALASIVQGQLNSAPLRIVAADALQKINSFQAAHYINRTLSGSYIDSAVEETCAYLIQYKSFQAIPELEALIDNPSFDGPRELVFATIDTLKRFGS